MPCYSVFPESHIGNAEEWYVSRLVPAETLPAEWAHDDTMPIFDKKVGQRYKYYLTDFGRHVASTVLQLRELHVIPALAHPPSAG